MRCFQLVRFRPLFALSVVCMLSASPAHADFVITGDNADVAAGSTATITFTISDSAPSQDTLSGFLLELQLTGPQGGGNSGVMQFSDISLQPEPYNSSNYVFSGNSFDQSIPPYWLSISSSVPGGTNDLAEGGDFAYDSNTMNFTSVSFSANTSYLLASMQVDATNAVVGDTYQIALVPANSSFQDANGSNIDYSSTAAKINIVAPVSAVPAPSSLILAGIGILTSLLYYRRRYRSKASLRSCAIH
jgi:hypothetical protein